MYYPRVTIFHIICYVGLCMGLGIGIISGYKQCGVLGAVIGGVVGMYCGGWLGFLPHRLGQRAMFRDIENSSIEELRRVVDIQEWNFYNTLALLQLSARGQDVNADLYRILTLLQSEDSLQRLYAWDALRLVFPSVAEQLASYNLNDSFAVCQSRISSFSHR